MKNRKTLLLYFVFLISFFPLYGAVMSRPHFVYSLTTEHFEVLYTDASEYTATLIQQNAEEYYKKASELLGVKFRTRIIVVLSPDSGVFSSRYTGVPYNRIVINDLPLKHKNPEYDELFLDTLQKEIINAVSQNVRSSFCNLAATLFGNMVQPVKLLNMPVSFLEGIQEINGESSGSFFDEYEDVKYLRLLSKAKAEGKFPTWQQAAGGYDLYPGKDMVIACGRGFSSYMISRWGMEKFIEFWQEGGKLDFFNLTAGKFKKVYGISLKDAWKDFELLVPEWEDVKPQRFIDGNAITDEEETLFPDRLMGTENTYRFLHKTPYGYVWYDEIRREICLLNTESELKWRELLFMADNVQNIDVSKDGRYIAVDFYGNKKRENLKRHIMWFYDLQKRCFTDDLFYDEMFDDTGRRSLVDSIIEIEGEGEEDPETPDYEISSSAVKFNPMKYLLGGGIIPLFAIYDIDDSGKAKYLPGLGAMFQTTIDPLENHSLVLSASAGFPRWEDNIEIIGKEDEDISEIRKRKLTFSGDFTGVAIYKNNTTPADMRFGIFTNLTKYGDYELAGIGSVSVAFPMGMSFRELKLNVNARYTFSTKYYANSFPEEFPSLAPWASLSDAYQWAYLDSNVFYSNVHQSGFSPYQKVGLVLDSRLWMIWDSKKGNKVAEEENNAIIPAFMTFAFNTAVYIPRILPVKNINGWVLCMPLSIKGNLFKDEENALTLDTSILIFGKEIQYGIPVLNFYLKRTGLYFGYKFTQDYSTKLPERTDIRYYENTAQALSNCVLNDSIYFDLDLEFAPIWGTYSESNMGASLRFEYFLRKNTWKTDFFMSFAL